MRHQPVMVEAVLAGLVQDRHGTYLDATFGRGGHACSILKLLAEDAQLVVMDRDPTAVCVAKQLSQKDSRVRVLHGRFSQLGGLTSDLDITQFSGILFDCGVSSPQLDDASRGFSFQRQGPLDMRMDSSQGMTAAEWLNTASEQSIAKVIREYGEERNARAIARSIVMHRPLKCTSQLSQIVSAATRQLDQGKHPATRTFQAIRMYVNDELQELSAGIDEAFKVLAVGGRLAVLTFHSLEHRLVRRKFRSFEQETVPRRLPIPGDLRGPGKVVVRKAEPSYLETSKNPRARSAMMQVLERVER